MNKMNNLDVVESLSRLLKSWEEIEMNFGVSYPLDFNPTNLNLELTMICLRTDCHVWFTIKGYVRLKDYSFNSLFD